MNLRLYWDREQGRIVRTEPPGWEKHIPIVMGHFILPHMVAAGVHDFVPLTVTVIDILKQEQGPTQVYPLNPVEVRKAEERKAEEQAKDGGGG